VSDPPRFQSQIPTFESACLSGLDLSTAGFPLLSIIVRHFHSRFFMSPAIRFVEAGPPFVDYFLVSAERSFFYYWDLLGERMHLPFFRLSFPVVPIHQSPPFCPRFRTFFVEESWFTTFYTLSFLEGDSFGSFSGVAPHLRSRSGVQLGRLWKTISFFLLRDASFCQ